MSGVLNWGWDATNKVWRPLKVSPAGTLYIIETVDHLNDIGDVNVPTPTDGYFLYWDNAASKWQCKALEEGDIPAAIARDTEVATAITTHKGDASAHHTKYTNAEAKAQAEAAKLDDHAAPDDNTDLNASAAKHGLMAKADKSKLDGIAAGADATPDANLTTKGKVELATAAETTTGTDATRAVTPDGLAGSKVAKRLFYVKVFDHDTAVATGDGKAHITIPEELNGMNLVAAHAAVYTVSSSGLPTVQIHNLTDTSDMLSTVITIDENEKNSYTAATPPVIDTGEDDVVTGDEIRIDVDVAGTGTKGLDVILVFQLP